MPLSANPKMPGAFEPFAFTGAESRSIVLAHTSQTPSYTFVGNAGCSNYYPPRLHPTREPPNACNCNICTAPAVELPPPYPFSRLERVMGGMHATIVAVCVFADILERHIRFVTPGLSRFLFQLASNTVADGIGLALAVIVLFCWYLWRAIFSFTARMSVATDRFGEELMPDMTFTPIAPWKGSKLTRYLIQQDKMMRKDKVVSPPLWFEVGTTGA